MWSARANAGWRIPCDREDALLPGAFPDSLQHAFLTVTGETLKEQGVTHNVKAMVLELKQSEEDVRKNVQVEEEKRNEAKLEEKRIQRTKRGLEILAERGAQCFRLFCSSPRRGRRREWAGLGGGELGVSQFSLAFLSQQSHIFYAPITAF